MSKVHGLTEDKFPIGWVDESNPLGRGLLIMTENGISVFDFTEKAEFEKEKERIKQLLKERGE